MVLASVAFFLGGIQKSFSKHGLWDSLKLRMAEFRMACLERHFYSRSLS